MPARKYAIVFPGQGSQVAGMGSAFRLQPEFRACLETADSLFPGPAKLSDLIFSGTPQQLQQTAVTQPALLTVEMGIWGVLTRQLPESPACLAGHSLGEYTALAAAGVLSFPAAFQLVVRRSQLMQQACEWRPGAMLAVLKADPGQITALCQSPPWQGRVVIGNYNSPEQLVLSGEADCLALLAPQLKSLGIRRTIPLHVQGAFHSPLMEQAGAELARAIESQAFAQARIPVVTNVDAQPTTAAQDFKAKLRQQLSAPVQWEATIRAMAAQGIRNFVEVGPGHVLSQLIRQTLPEATVYGLATEEDLHRFIDTFAL